MKIRLSDEALLDLQEISNYTWAEWGEAQERKYLALLYVTMERFCFGEGTLWEKPDK